MLRIVDTTSGQIEGIIYGNGVQFLGIPYAEPPIGDLRWKVAYELSQPFKSSITIFELGACVKETFEKYTVGQFLWPYVYATRSSVEWRYKSQ